MHEEAIQNTSSNPFVERLRPNGLFMKEAISTLRSTSKVVARHHDSTVQLVTDFVDRVRPVPNMHHHNLPLQGNVYQRSSSTYEENERQTDDNVVTTEKEEFCPKTPSETSEKKSGYKIAREAGVAVVGGGLIAVGIPLIPLPGPGDLMVVGGLALLATEFPAAQGVLDSTRDKLEDVLDRSHNRENKNEESKQHGNVSSDDQQQDIHDENRTAVEDVEIAFEEASVAVQNHAEALGRNVVLPMLDHVCTTTHCTGNDDSHSNSRVQ